MRLNQIEEQKAQHALAKDHRRPGGLVEAAEGPKGHTGEGPEWPQGSEKKDMRLWTTMVDRI